MLIFIGETEFHSVKVQRDLVSIVRQYNGNTRAKNQMYIIIKPVFINTAQLWSI